MLRNRDEIAKMRRAGRVVAEMHARIRDAIKPGVTTGELDQIGREVIAKHGAKSNFLHYGPRDNPFPAVICASPNDVIVHGIPGDLVLEEGDIISIDCGAIIEGYHGDSAWTYPVGEIDAESQRLLDVTEKSLWAGLGQVKAGNRLFDIGGAVQQVAEAAGFTVVREYVGHGIGTAMHEPPQIPNYRPSGGANLKLKVGHVFAIEPMVNAGTAQTELLDDGWTVVTADGKRSAHFEHTIAITENGPEVLTRG